MIEVKPLAGTSIFTAIYTHDVVCDCTCNKTGDEATKSFRRKSCLMLPSTVALCNQAKSGVPASCYWKLKDVDTCSNLWLTFTYSSTSMGTWKTVRRNRHLSEWQIRMPEAKVMRQIMSPFCFLFSESTVGKTQSALQPPPIATTVPSATISVLSSAHKVCHSLKVREKAT